MKEPCPPPPLTHTHTHTPFSTPVSPVCDSYVRPETLVRICDECNFGTYGGRCIICGSPGERGFWIRFVSALTPLPISFRFLRDHRLFDVPFTLVALSLPLIQGFPTPITVLSARAWRRTATAVRRSSTLVPVEQIYSMNGVVSVRLHSFPQLVNIYLTLFQGSKRVDPGISSI